MTLQEVYEFFGSEYAVCKAVGLALSSTTYWNKKGYVPFKTQKHIELLSKGKLIASKEDNNKPFKKKSLPSFKYKDKKLGLCEIESITFRKGKTAKIVCTSPENKTQKFTVFITKNLIIKS